MDFPFVAPQPFDLAPNLNANSGKIPTSLTGHFVARPSLFLREPHFVAGVVSRRLCEIHSQRVVVLFAAQNSQISTGERTILNSPESAGPDSPKMSASPGALRPPSETFSLAVSPLLMLARSTAASS